MRLCLPVTDKRAKVDRLGSISLHSDEGGCMSRVDADELHVLPFVLVKSGSRLELDLRTCMQRKSFPQ